MVKQTRRAKLTPGPRRVVCSGADNAEFMGEYYDEDDGEFKAEYAMFGKLTRRAAPAPTPAR